MNAPVATVDFGAPDDFGVHIFQVQIASARTDPVLISEHYGYNGPGNGRPDIEVRVALKRAVWSEIADTARREFNARLKAKKLSTGRWRTGETRIERLLGKELCVLAWAAETATPEQILVICSKWAALRPEERWWLFSMTVAEAGLPDDTHRGWRRALFYALSDGEKALPRRPTRKLVEADASDLRLL